MKLIVTGNTTLLDSVEVRRCAIGTVISVQPALDVSVVPELDPDPNGATARRLLVVLRPPRLHAHLLDDCTIAVLSTSPDEDVYMRAKQVLVGNNNPDGSVTVLFLCAANLIKGEVEVRKAFNETDESETVASDVPTVNTPFGRAEIVLCNYASNRTRAIRLVDRDSGEPITTLTVNLPGARYQLGPTETFIKTWSENEPLVRPLLASGYFTDTGIREPTGMTEAQVWRLTEKLLAATAPKAVS